MRKANAILSAAILLLLLLHGVLGAFQLIGVSGSVLKSVSWLLAALLALHALIGLKLTIDTLRVSRKAGVSYMRENRLFWLRRISGLAIMLFLFCHVMAFSYVREGALRLHPFGGIQLAAQLLLLASVAVHVLSNLRPLAVAFGAPGIGRFLTDLLIVLTAALLFMGAGFVVYYLRWNVW